MVPLGRLAKAVAIFVVFVLLKATWIGAWAYARRQAARYQEKRPSAKRVMQITDVDMINTLTGLHVNPRFRTCGKCRSALGDRMWHSTRSGVHYPVYDHYCFWLRLPVFLHTIKPYLIVCAALDT